MTSAAGVRSPRLTDRLRKHFPGGQFVRYLCVGVFNTLFGYCTFVVAPYLLNLALPQRFLYLTVILASVLSTPLNITVAYFGYKFFVFRTHGNYLKEWLRCFAVYGVSTPAELLILPLATSAFLHIPLLHPYAPFLAGGVNAVIIASYSYFAHKKFSFKR